MLKPNNKLMPYLFILPSLILIIIFSYYACGYAFYASFTDLRLGFKENFVGFDNYVSLFTDSVFYKSLLNQLILLTSDVIKSNIFPLTAALLLFFIRRRNISDILKRLFVFPMLVPQLVIFLMFINIYSPTMGALNTILEVIGLQEWQHDWLNESKTAMGSIIFMGFPFISGMFFLIYHSAINNVSSEMIEAASIDGCNELKIVKHIHIPNIIPYFGTVTILSIIGSMQNYVRILLATQGGPNGYDTFIPAIMLYKRGFENDRMGYASTIGVFLFIIIMALTIISFKVSRAKEDYN